MAKPKRIKERIREEHDLHPPETPNGEPAHEYRRRKRAFPNWVGSAKRKMR